MSTEASPCPWAACAAAWSIHKGGSGSWHCTRHNSRHWEPWRTSAAAPPGDRWPPRGGSKTVGPRTECAS